MSTLPTLCVTGKLEWIYCAGSTGRSTHYTLLTLERSSNGTELDTLTHWSPVRRRIQSADSWTSGRTPTSSIMSAWPPQPFSALNHSDIYEAIQ